MHNYKYFLKESKYPASEQRTKKKTQFTLSLEKLITGIELINRTWKQRLDNFVILMKL